MKIWTKIKMSDSTRIDSEFILSWIYAVLMQNMNNSYWEDLLSIFILYSISGVLCVWFSLNLDHSSWYLLFLHHHHLIFVLCARFTAIFCIFFCIMYSSLLFSVLSFKSIIISCIFCWIVYPSLFYIYLFYILYSDPQITWSIHLGICSNIFSLFKLWF